MSIDASANAPSRAGVYLDGFATMPIAPEARAAMIDALDLPANASSPHALGERAADLIDCARRDVAALAGCAPSELTFTSGATEANNLAILGGARAIDAVSGRRRRIIISAIEHKSVMEPSRALLGMGFEVSHAPVCGDGRIDVGALSDLISDDCWLVSVMAVNNETGVVQPIAEVVEIAHARGALTHCDASQALGKIPTPLADWDVDYASMSGHKVYGPSGVGALYVAAGAPAPVPLQFGGGQQSGRRPGTEPTALIVGFGAAAAAASRTIGEDRLHGERLVRRFVEDLSARQIHFAKVTGDADTVPGSLSLQIPGCDADDLCARLSREVFLSTGSACTSGQINTSHVLSAMGLTDLDARSVIRLMINRYLTEADIIYAAERVAGAVMENQKGAGRFLQ